LFDIRKFISSEWDGVALGHPVNLLPKTTGLQWFVVLLRLFIQKKQPKKTA
jgi:hypothetical protein